MEEVFGREELTRPFDNERLNNLFSSEQKHEMQKVIAQLEAENAELKIVHIPQLERKIASIRGAHSVDCKKLNARTEQVERLKKENAELRKQVSAMSKALVLNVLEWHDLRKNQNDLPDNSRYVWTNAGAGYHDDDGWWDAFGRLQNVIAWCEPKFEKEAE